VEVHDVAPDILASSTRPSRAKINRSHQTRRLLKISVFEKSTDRLSARLPTLRLENVRLHALACPQPQYVTPQAKENRFFFLDGFAVHDMMKNRRNWLWIVKEWFKAF